MKIINKKKKNIIVVVILVILFSIIIFVWLNRDLVFNNNEVSEKQDNLVVTEDNRVDYELPTEEQKTASTEKSKDEKFETESFANKIIISNSGKNEAGDYEISVYSSELTDSNAKCILYLNGNKYIEVGVQIYPHMAVCRGFTILNRDIKDDQNNYEIQMIAKNYKDKIIGVFEK